MCLFNPKSNANLTAFLNWDLQIRVEGQTLDQLSSQREKYSGVRAPQSDLEEHQGEPVVTMIISHTLLAHFQYTSSNGHTRGTFVLVQTFHPFHPSPGMLHSPRTQHQGQSSRTILVKCNTFIALILRTNYGNYHILYSECLPCSPHLCMGRNSLETIISRIPCQCYLVPCLLHIAPHMCWQANNGLNLECESTMQCTTIHQSLICISI